MAGLSTTVFFIVVAACFARCNPRFERWVLDLTRIGPLVRDDGAVAGTVSPEEVALIPAKHRNLSGRRPCAEADALRPEPLGA